jgi:PAS domain S-box-containing protein
MMRVNRGNDLVPFPKLRDQQICMPYRDKDKAEQPFEGTSQEQIELLKKNLKEFSYYKYALDESSIVAITDQKGIITYANDNFCKISKYSKEELIGQDHRIINSGYHPKAFIRNLWVTIANGKIWKGELKNKAKDGTVYWVDTTIVPFLNEEGKPYQYVAIRADITQRKEAENQLREINEDLEEKVKARTLELTAALEREKEMNEMKSRFVSMASHEFRTPLSAVLSSVSLIDKYAAPENEEKRKKHIDRIKSSVRNLTDILNDFLSLDKLEEGKVDVETQSFKLNEFLEDCVEEMEGMLRKRDQRIIFNHDDDKEVVQDKKILRNIMHNLLSNAIKYSADEKEIHLSAKVNDRHVSITVKDEGIGIPEEEQKHLFDKFFRAKNAVNIQGTGLGLNIVKKYVELIGGSITHSSKADAGTSFTIEFPIH